MRNRGATAHRECVGAGVGLGSVAYKTCTQGRRVAWLGRLWLQEVVGSGGTCEGTSELEWGKQKKAGGGNIKLLLFFQKRKTLGRRCGGWGLSPNASLCWLSPVWFYSFLHR